MLTQGQTFPAVPIQLSNGEISAASLLAELKARGYKVVHMVPKTTATTLPEYDAIAEKALKAKHSVSAADPLATRSVTWPVSGAADGAGAGDGTTSGDTAGTEAAAPAPTPVSATRGSRRGAKTNWGNLSEDPWQLKSFGTAGAP